MEKEELIHKNKEIALMLGWKEEPLLHCWLKADFTTVNEDFKFHSDANWQFEAIEWIEKKYYKSNYITSKMNFLITKTCLNKKYSCEISMDDRFLPKFTIFTQEYTLKEAIFEALYQFSQYLKTKQ